MSGHSKFANIKHKKAKNDAVKGKIFTKIGREIAVAVKEGGADPSTNKRLYDAILKGKTNNMSVDTIDKAIKKASGDKDANNYEKVVYEGYGPNGIAVIVEALTDNKNRTAGNVRSYFTKGNGNMGTSGCVSFLFSEKGQILIEKDVITEEKLTDIAIDSGAEDIIANEDGFEIITSPEDFSVVYERLQKEKIDILSGEVKMIPSTYVKLNSQEDIKSMNKLIDLLDEDDDVQDVWHNWDEE